MAAIETLNYEKIKSRQFENAVATKVLGVPLAGDLPIAKIAGRDFRPIQWCLCVWDSPESPCPCDDFLLWLPVDKVIRSVETKRQTASGETIHSFLVLNDAEVLLEQPVRSHNIRSLQTSMGLSEELSRLGAGTSFPVGVSLKVNRVVVQIIKTAVIAAIDWLAENWGKGESTPSNPPSH